MKRRDFLVGAAVGAATVVGLPGQGAQTPDPGGRQGAPGGQGRRPAEVCSQPPTR